jgi:sugar fermentation stimulation protein A
MVTYHPPLEQAVLLRRYKRFLADIEFPDGTRTTAHCTNTGRMTGCCEPGSRVLVSRSDNPKRKLAWTLHGVKVGRSWVSVDTLAPNRVIADALRRRHIPELAAYDQVATEVRYGVDGRSRIDVLLTHSQATQPPCYVEVKNVTLRDGDHAIFPDAVSARGTKHLAELEREVGLGNRAVLIPFVPRVDITLFDAAREVDPDWSMALDSASAAGVEILPWRARLDRRGLRLDCPLPWVRREIVEGGV